MEQASPWLETLRSAFLQQRQLAEAAIAQLDGAELLRTAGDGGNSVAVLMRHVGGNLRSRWTEPFTTDGEKPDRDRDSEFDVQPAELERVREIWRRGWETLEAALAGFSPAELERTVRIRGVAMPLREALVRSLVHTAQHVGQVLLLAKHWRGDDWETLSIPRGRSAEFLHRPPSS
jgi:uncharacterized damage-inducible protein DinB